MWKLFIQASISKLRANARRYLARRKSRAFPALDEAAQQAFSEETEINFECIALLSLLQHAFLIFPNKFSYLKCLDHSDRLPFQVQYVQLLVQTYASPQDRRLEILSGKITLDTWLNVMYSVKLEFPYEVYRYATQQEVVRYGNDCLLTPYHTLEFVLEATGENPMGLTYCVLHRPGHRTEFTVWFMPQLFPEHERAYRDGVKITSSVDYRSYHAAPPAVAVPILQVEQNPFTHQTAMF